MPELMEALRTETLQPLGTRVPPTWRERLARLYPGRRIGHVLRDLILDRLLEAEAGRQGVRRERRKRFLRGLIKLVRRFERDR